MPRSSSTDLRTKAACAVCKEPLSARGMGRHLETHLHDRESRKPGMSAFHLRADDGGEIFWMHLVLPQDATLRMLDHFLRRTWLECCGHMSAFTIDGMGYDSAGDEESLFDIYGERHGTMDVPLAKVLRPGLTFSYEYDFGTTTELRLRVLSSGPYGQEKGVKVLARNDPPDIRCETCKQEATQVCSVCIGWKKAWCCGRCMKKHAEQCDGEEMFLPVVNSPRVGQCGYEG